MSHLVRQPAVAGSFYPDDPVRLTALIETYLDDTQPIEHTPKALIVPHAGYIYSGAIAASAYAGLNRAAHIRRVVLIGPSHRVPFTGIAVPKADVFTTPLGDISIDIETRDTILALPFVQYLEQAHTAEHSLEVQLPFLQHQLSDFKLLPLVAGNAEPEQISRLLEEIWDGRQTLIVISSDLSHYLSYTEAQILDRQTSEVIETLEYEKLQPDWACGHVPISGLICYARKHGLKIKTIDLRNSGDTAGDKNRVVGYGAYVIE